MTKKHVFAFVVLGTVAVVGWAVSIPNTFTAQTAARAADVNANFTALTNAVNALEAKVAALEAVNSPLTAADVVGTYKLLGMSASVGGNSGTAGEDSMSVANDSSNASVTFAANAACTATVPCNFTYAEGPKSHASATCMNTDAQTNQGGGPQHSHGYKITDCNSSVQDDAGGGPPGGGTWSLGPAANTITVNPTGGQTLTAFISKRGGVGFAVEVEPTEDANNPGKRIQFEVFIKQ